MINSVLSGAFDWNIVLNIVNLLPIAAFVIGGLIGFTHGARRLSWIGDSWMFAVALYAILLSVLESMNLNLGPAVPVIVAAIVCSTVALLFFTFVRLVLYPRELKIDNLQMQKFLRREERFRQIEREEFEELDDPYDEDEREKLERMQDKRRKKYLDKLDGRPGLFSRLFAAVFEGVDYAFVMGVIVDVLAIVIMSTPLATGVLADFCALEGFQTIYREADKVILDYVLIGIVMCSVCVGYKKGVLSSIYGLLAAVASIGVATAAFYLPFSPLAAEGGMFAFIGSMSSGIGGWVGSMLAGVIPFEIPSAVTFVIGQIASGIVLFLVLQILLSILLKVLGGAAALSAENSVFHVIDGIFGVLLGVLVCALAIAAVMFVLLIFEQIGWYAAGATLFEGTDLFSVCYDAMGEFAKPWVEKVVGMLPF
jgi:hypothetical protein